MLKEQQNSTPARAGLKVGDEQYLWLLVILEVGFLFWGRYIFRRLHGG